MGVYPALRPAGTWNGSPSECRQWGLRDGVRWGPWAGRGHRGAASRCVVGRGRQRWLRGSSNRETETRSPPISFPGDLPAHQVRGAAEIRTRLGTQAHLWRLWAASSWPRGPHTCGLLCWSQPPARKLFLSLQSSFRLHFLREAP